MSIATRVGKLEQVHLKGALDITEAGKQAAERDLKAIRFRCQMIASVTDDEVLKADMQEVIRAIDEGRYPTPEPTSANMDERARLMRERMLAQFG